MITDYLECIEIEGTRQIKQYEPLKIRVKIKIHDEWEHTAVRVKRAIIRLLYSELLETDPNLEDIEKDDDDDIRF
jgi:hypothetical protein